MTRLFNRWGRYAPINGKQRAIFAFRAISVAIIAFLSGFYTAISLCPEQISTADVSPPSVKHLQVVEKSAETKKSEPTQAGTASWYDYDLNGLDWSKHHRTCASRYFKRYSTVIVKNMATGKEIECYVNDFIEHPDRIIDLSSFAFSQLADLKIGLIKVEVRYK